MVRTLNPQKHETQRLRLVAQARRLFAAQGVKETSMAQVAKACRVTKAALYHYFKGKDGLLKAILGCRSEEIQDFRQRISATRDPEECFYVFGRIHLESMALPGNLDLMKILLTETLKNKDMRRYYQEFVETHVAQTAREVVGRFAPDLTEKEMRLAFYQFLAALLHYTWNVSVVGNRLDDLIGDTEMFLRRLARLNAAGIRQSPGGGAGDAKRTP
jgi:AcrR family transcriptional regulator